MMQHVDIEREILEMFEENTGFGLDYIENEHLTTIATSQTMPKEDNLTQFTNPQTKAKLLYCFALSVIRLKPKISTSSAFTTIELPLLPYHKKTLEKLLKLLIHAITILNITYRMKDKNGIFQSTKEDYINALELMKDLSQLYHEKRTNFDKELISLLSGKYKPTDIFTRKDLEKLFGYSKSNIKNIARYLENRQIIRKINNNRHRGYKYQIAVNQ